jgi:DNA helicase-2/ATP-dependent DNA helicase PcrA
VLVDEPLMLVSAGAGSGKTKTVTHRILRLLADGWMASSVLAITFTNKAADEMRDRLIAAGLSPRQLPMVSTFHGFALRVIQSLPHLIQRTEQMRVLDEVDAEDFLRRAARDARCKVWEKSKLSKLREDPKVVAAYQEALRAADAVDFDIIESGCWTVLQHEEGIALWRGRFAHIFVDEYQDTNPVQSKIADALRPEHLFVVGDDRQSIYGFRGSDPAFIREAMTSPAWTHIELADNFRSLPEIVKLANSICADSSPMVARREGEGVARMFVDERPEPGLRDAIVAFRRNANGRKGGAWKDVAVLARTWAQLAEMEFVLKSASIPCRVYSEKYDPWRTATGRSIAAALQLVCSPYADDLALRIYAIAMLDYTTRNPLAERPGEVRDVRGFATTRRKSVLHHLVECADFAPTPGGEVWKIIADAQRDDSALELAKRVAELVSFPIDELLDVLDSPLLRGASVEDFIGRWAFRATADAVKPNEDVVHLMTIHAAKGLEWPMVVVLDVRDGVFPARRVSSTEESEEEDRRVLYVGATRARDMLVLSRPSVTTWFDGRQIETIPSPFLGFLEVA